MSYRSYDTEYWLLALDHKLAFCWKPPTKEISVRSTEVDSRPLLWGEERERVTLPEGEWKHFEATVRDYLQKKT